MSKPAAALPPKKKHVQYTIVHGKGWSKAGTGSWITSRRYDIKKKTYSMRIFKLVRDGWKNQDRLLNKSIQMRDQHIDDIQNSTRNICIHLSTCSHVSMHWTIVESLNVFEGQKVIFLVGTDGVPPRGASIASTCTSVTPTLTASPIHQSCDCNDSMLVAAHNYDVLGFSRQKRSKTIKNGIILHPSSCLIHCFLPNIKSCTFSSSG